MQQAIESRIKPLVQVLEKNKSTGDQVFAIER